MIMRRRMRGPSLIGVAATTAVVAGTAGAVSNKQQQKAAAQGAAADQQAQEAAMQQQLADQQAQIDAMQQQAAAAPPPPAAAPPAAESDLTAKLQQLSELHTSGALTDEEFAAAKQKLLGV